MAHFVTKILIKKIVFTVPAFLLETLFLKTVWSFGFSLTDGHSGRVAVGVKQNVRSHSTLCEGHVFCRPHHTEDFRKKKMVTTITGIGLVYHIIFFYPIKCLSIKKMIDYKHFILRLKN